jgi:hypothetical protein
MRSLHPGASHTYLVADLEDLVLWPLALVISPLPYY